VTCLDGYQMALQGRAGPALGIAAIGSFIAGTIGVVLLMLVSPALAKWALSFGPPETFALMLLGLTTCTLLAGEDPLKGYISMVFGLMLAMVGFDIISGDARYGFGIVEMMDGIDFLPAAIGLFGLGEVLAGAEQKGANQLKTSLKLRDVLPGVADWARSKWAIARGTVMGFAVGVLPGAGPTVASFLAYTVEKKVSKTPERFGKGAIEGVAGPESANNAGAQTSFVPMLTLGIPSNPLMALMIGALMIQGIQPGPQVMTKQPELFWGVIASMWIGNLMLLIMNLPLIGVWVSLLRVPYRLLFPAIVALCCVGAYTVSNSLFDVWLVLLFGLVGFFFIKIGVEPAPLVLGFVLGPMLEEHFRRSMLISSGDMTVFVTRPISAVLLAIAVVLLAALLSPAIRAKREALAEE
jgi:putative tricarboxylic transport membrane protein